MAITFDIQNTSGLTESCAAQRLREEGYNELPSSKRRTVLAIALEVVREPMFLMLVACGGLYMLMGELTDALMLLGFVFVVMGITIVQERRTERALEALKDLSSPRALVIRDGRQKRIAGRDVVRGDMILLAEGDRVPADAVLLQGINLSVDESLLTGESVPVRKAPSAGAAVMGPPGGDDLPFLFSGTLVTGGQGVAEVQRTGMRTELGKIGKAIQTLEPEQTLLQKETGRLVRYLAVVGLALCGIVVVAYGLSRGGSAEAWQGGFLAGITMAMATLPEELPVILTIFLALGAWRISQSRVLTRRMPAIETLGAATVLCVDKTGTLTLNQMSVQQISCDGEVLRLPPRTRRLCRRRFTVRWNSPFWRASGIRSIRWKRPSGCWARSTWPPASTSTTTGRWCMSIPFPPNCLRFRTSGNRRTGRTTSWPPRGRPRRLPTCATLRHEKGNR